jgi:hypothetical protein
MRRPRAVIALALTLIAIVIGAIALAGGDGEDTKADPAPRRTTTGETTPPGAAGALPPEFVDCMAEQGFEIDSPDDIHSAPPQALQACFGSLHQ